MTKLAVITGSSGGIGQATAQRFARDGWEVVGLDRVAPATPTDQYTHVECDLADTKQIRAALTTHVGDRPLHALVNNAALQLNKALRDTSDDEWDAVMQVNVRAAFACLRDTHESLVAARGAVVNVASVHAVATSSNISAYAASKGALVALTRAAAVELADRGVRCNAVLPGAVDTAMLRDGLGRREHPDGPEGNLRELVNRTPLLAVASPDDIAATISFLADNDQSAFTTGQALVVDGGATARLSTE